MSGKVQTDQDQKKAKQLKNEVKNMLMIFFVISGIVR
jgi:nitrate reductase NapE component